MFEPLVLNADDVFWLRMVIAAIALATFGIGGVAGFIVGRSM